MKQPEDKKRNLRMIKFAFVIILIFITYYIYSSYILTHNNEVIVLCTFGAILCMGIKCVILVSQNKKTSISTEMEDDV